ncbi:Peptidase propeptide and YPEB domain protein [Methyloligella halotolerans]|uniref:Peptidase propeptide and YPEB domain protein n=1 Tax=Methyloligella halotolerans TaxID=1177755 RepID=A0A1E2RYF7_9HYPH|nr:PepSY domain-containing protein [Methyloligella halotolerans]ODA67145.1 Peptidase propeptide and YPEB domain protein [Methyloligella halotolerans]
MAVPAAILLLAAALTVPGRVRGDDDDDHEFARRAVEQGLVAPLAEIAAKVSEQIDGEIIEVELDKEDGVYVYEFKILTKHGRLKEVEVDANTAEILDMEDED